MASGNNRTCCPRVYALGYRGRLGPNLKGTKYMNKGYVVACIYPSISNFWPFADTEMGEAQAIECYNLNVMLAQKAEVVTDVILLLRVMSDHGQCEVLKRWTPIGSTLIS